MLAKLLTSSTIVYIDFGNVREWRRRLEWEIDLAKLKSFLDSFGVKEVRFYFGTEIGSEKFMTFVHNRGYAIRTKPVKKMKISIDVSNISLGSKDILASFIKPSLLKRLRPEAIEFLNDQLGALNNAGHLYIECPKCNFDVEIGTDMLVAHHLGEADSFCLFSGDGDFADALNTILKTQKRATVFGTARYIASELNALQAKGLQIVDIATLRDFLEKTP
jgi:uncharacterized LabA/DUF88 family protein